MKTLLPTLDLPLLLVTCLALTASICFAAAPGEPSGTAPQRSERHPQTLLEWQEWPESSGPLETYTLSFAGWFARRRFTTPAFLGWIVLWLILVWLALAGPYAAFNVLGGSRALVAVLAVAGSASLVSFVVTLPFLVLAAANPLYRQRLQQLVMPPDLT